MSLRSIAKPHPEIEGLFYAIHDGYTVAREGEPEFVTNLRHYKHCGKCRVSLVKGVSRETFPWVALGLSWWLGRRGR